MIKKLYHIFFITRPGLPATTQLSGISPETTVPTDKIEFYPITVPGQIIHPGLIQAPDFIFTDSTFLG